MKRILTFLFSSQGSTLVTFLLLIVAGLTWNRWWPAVNGLVDRATHRNAPAEESEHDDHAAGHTAAAFLDLSPEALKNLGLNSETIRPIELKTYQKSISVPAMIVERPGQTLVQISTPMTGVVTEVAAVEGSAVEAGQRLFRIRLTHEDLVQTQTDFVRSLGELDVENREITRLEGVSESGAVSGKSLLERKYAKEKLEAFLGAQREALRLHGLSQRQIEQISKDRRLLSELTIVTPSANQSADELELTAFPKLQPISFVADPDVAGERPVEPKQAPAVPLIVESLKVQRGQSVEQGGQLCVLADYSQLYIEGLAFEQDFEVINKASTAGWKISALLPGGSELNNLTLSFVASEIDPESRTLKFYVDLPNEILRDTKNANGRRFLTWRFKPGQRLQLRVPTDELPNQIVLPLDAVATEGAESFVFQRKGKQRFERIAVHVLFRDQTTVVVSNDGALFPGDVVALRGAHQLQMAVKNKSGGAIDPHAGHNH